MIQANYSLEILEKAKTIKAISLDMDGIMTNGEMILSSESVGSRVFNALDGYGMKLLGESGIHIAITTASTYSPIVEKRAKEIGIKHVALGRFDKYEAMSEIAEKIGIDVQQFAYMGDDFPDIKAIQLSGFGVSVPNGHPIVRKYADYVTVNSSRNGAIREVCDLILIAQGKMDNIISSIVS